MRRLRRQRLPAGECQQTMRQCGRPVSGTPRALDVAGQIGRTATLQPGLHQFQGSDNAGEQIIEIMRQAAGQLPHRLHFLALPQRLLHRLALRQGGLDALFQHGVGDTQLSLCPGAAQRVPDTGGDILHQPDFGARPCPRQPVIGEQRRGELAIADQRHRHHGAGIQRGPDRRLAPRLQRHVMMHHGTALALQRHVGGAERGQRQHPPARFPATGIDGMQVHFLAVGGYFAVTHTGGAKLFAQHGNRGLHNRGRVAQSQQPVGQQQQEALAHFGMFAVGHIHRHAGKTNRHAGRVMSQPPAGEHPALNTIRPDDAMFGAEVGRAVVKTLHGVAHVLRIFGMDIRDISANRAPQRRCFWINTIDPGKIRIAENPAGNQVAIPCTHHTGGDQCQGQAIFLAGH